MPLYDFRCKNCDTTYQEFSSYSERDKVKCPTCGSEEKEQVYKNKYNRSPISSSSGCGSSGSGFS